MDFYFRATLEVKEVLQSSKFDFDFLWFVILHRSQSLKMCFRKKMCVCVCLSVCPSPNIEPKAIDRPRSKSISRVLMQISRAVFYFRATLGVKEVLQSSKKFDFDFLWLFILHHSHLKMCFRKKMCVCVCLSVCPSPNIEPKPTHQSRWKSISRVLSQISRTFVLVFPLPLRLRVVHIKKYKISIFSNGSNDFD